MVEYGYYDIYSVFISIYKCNIHVYVYACSGWTGLQLCGRINGVCRYMFGCPFVKHHSKHNLVIWSTVPWQLAGIVLLSNALIQGKRNLYVHTALSMSNTKHEISLNMKRETKSFLLIYFFEGCVIFLKTYLYLHLASCFWVCMDHHQVIKPSAAAIVSTIDGGCRDMHKDGGSLQNRSHKGWHKSHAWIWFRPWQTRGWNLSLGEHLRDAPFWRENNPEGSRCQQCCQSAG